jgi:hypothetical protein
MAPADLQALRERIGALEIAGWADENDPIGSYLTIELPEGTRTFSTSHVPSEAIPVFQLLDREGGRLFGSAYRPIAVPRQGSP